METQLSAVDFVKVQAAMAAEAAKARAMAHGRTVTAVNGWEDSGAMAAKLAAPPLMYHLTYRDAAGDESRRIVTLRRLDPDRTGLKLICWCHEAQAVRCFSAEGIQEVFDAATGEVHDEPALFFRDHPLLNEPRDPVDYALRVCKHEVNVLVAVGAADGRFDPDEQDRVLVHVFDRLPQLAMDEDLMRSRLCSMVLDVAAFEAAMLQLGRFRRGDAVALMRSLRKLVDADGRVGYEETVFVNEVQARLAAAL